MHCDLSYICLIWNFKLWNKPSRWENGDCISKTSFFYLLGKSESFLISIWLIENSRITHTDLKHLSHKEKTPISGCCPKTGLLLTFLLLRQSSIYVYISHLYGSGISHLCINFSSQSHEHASLHVKSRLHSGPHKFSHSIGETISLHPVSPSFLGYSLGRHAQILSLPFSPITTQFIFSPKIIFTYKLSS